MRGDPIHLLSGMIFQVVFTGKRNYPKSLRREPSNGDPSHLLRTKTISGTIGVDPPGLTERNKNIKKHAVFRMAERSTVVM